MKKLNNPFTQLHNFNCFGCAPHNKFGLQLEFYLLEEKEEKVVISEWLVPEHFDGWGGFLHGGITAALIDEVAGWYIFSVLGVAGMTSNLNIKYLKPIKTENNKLKIVAKLKERKRQLSFIIVNIYDNDNNNVAQGEACYFCFSERESFQKFMYPGKTSFYKSED